MTEPGLKAPTKPGGGATTPLRVWHLALLVLFVAVAIRNIQDQRRTEPALIALAVSGFVAYGVLGWLAWPLTGRFGRRFGRAARLALYLAAMGALFLLSTVVYLILEYVYLVGRR